MDLLAPSFLASSLLSASASRVAPSRMNKHENLDDEEEILTSDVEELAELAANRSLERYLDPANNSRPDKILQKANFEREVSLRSLCSRKIRQKIASICNRVHYQSIRQTTSNARQKFCVSNSHYFFLLKPCTINTTFGRGGDAH